MRILLTPQRQQQQLDTQAGDTPCVIDPRTNSAYVLVPQGDFVAAREILEEERLRQEIHATALRNAVGRLNKVP